jgi:hypothetical protein
MGVKRKERERREIWKWRERMGGKGGEKEGGR